jgi:hypothetical protein
MGTSINACFGRNGALRYSPYPGTAPLLKRHFIPKNAFIEVPLCIRLTQNDYSVVVIGLPYVCSVCADTPSCNHFA